MLNPSMMFFSLTALLSPAHSGPEPFNLMITDAPYRAPAGTVDLEIPDDEEHAFLEGIIEDIFPRGHKGFFTEEKAIEILRYTSSALELKNNGGSATKILREGYAICGGLSHVFRILCRKVGIPSRYVGAFYLRPLMGSHAISEVYYGGRWHLLDPTFGLFFYSKDRYDKKGRIASFHDLTIDHHSWHAFKVVDKPWSGTYNEQTRSYGIMPAEPDYLAEVYNSSIIELYRKYVETTFPVAYGSNDRVSFPVDADVREGGDFRVGELDGESRDVVMQALNGSTYVGSHYVGGSFPPGFHTWSIKAAVGTRLTLSYFAVGEGSPKLTMQPLKGVRSNGADYTEMGTTFGLLVIDDEAIVSIHCPTGTFIVDAMKLEKASE